ncbi:MAG: hypothetical protein L3J52_08080 [Proteobacteria bacterium]|nr:hypothetical protein [Pseudomonadota bacterium]
MKKYFLLPLLTLLCSFSAQAVQFSMSYNGLEDLGPNARYEGWLIVDGSPITTGIFSVDGSGVPSQSVVDVPANVFEAATLFILTIEPFPDPDPAPADTHILAGPIVGGRATLTVDHPAAIGNDFTAAMGSFILAAPSDTGAVGGYQNGLWYLNPPMPFSAGLSLPTLPAGWIYEGWVVDTVAGTPISTGTFLNVTGADSDGAGPDAGPGGTPAFPGQDFITPLRDLTASHLAVISIEPVPDNSMAPFTLKPLVTTITDPGAGGIPQGMTNNAVASNPTGTIMGPAQTVPSLGLVGIMLLLLFVVYASRRKTSV